jgi:hypothetical protein
MSDVELKPCRQCGGKAKSNTYDVSIECTDCGYEEETAETWNGDRPITLDHAKAWAAANNCAIVPIEVSEAIKPLLEYAMDYDAVHAVIVGELGEMVARMDNTYLPIDKAQEQAK